jgi:hypothetical protein
LDWLNKINGKHIYELGITGVLEALNGMPGTKAVLEYVLCYLCSYFCCGLCCRHPLFHLNSTRIDTGSLLCVAGSRTVAFSAPNSRCALSRSWRGL